MDYKQIFYKTKCKCTVTVEGTKRKKGYSRVCREHGEPVLSGFRECLDCDAIIELKNTGKGPFRCEEHARQHKIKMRHELYMKNRGRWKKSEPKNKHFKEFSIDVRGDYCTCLSACNLNGDLKCSECDKFIPIFRGVDPGRLGIGAL